MNRIRFGMKAKHFCNQFVYFAWKIAFFHKIKTDKMCATMINIAKCFNKSSREYKKLVHCLLCTNDEIKTYKLPMKIERNVASGTRPCICMGAHIPTVGCMHVCIHTYCRVSTWCAALTVVF